MDDLERELRSELDRLASDPAPSDTLVERTVDRTSQIRRRRVLSASCAGAAVLAVTVVVASTAAGAYPQWTEYQLDDGTCDETYKVKDYAPADFGPHSLPTPTKGP